LHAQVHISVGHGAQGYVLPRTAAVPSRWASLLDDQVGDGAAATFVKPP
jgi:hypothetical protein